MPTDTEITEGDTVTLTVPSEAVGLARASIDGGKFTVEAVSDDGETRLHVTPEGTDAPRYALRLRHVTLVD